MSRQYHPYELSAWSLLWLAACRKFRGVAGWPGKRRTGRRVLDDGLEYGRGDVLRRLGKRRDRYQRSGLWRGGHNVL